MAISPEIKVEIPPQVEQIPETYQESPIEQAEGIQSTPSTPTNIPQVQVPSGQTIQAVPAPATAGPSITLPSDPAILTAQAKGSVSNTQTWSAAFWLRMMKKAILKHIQILVGGKPDA